jgi:hypothetical protein
MVGVLGAAAELLESVKASKAYQPEDAACEGGDIWFVLRWLLQHVAHERQHAAASHA